MKRTLLFLACILASMAMQAQEYFPEGTKWTEIRLDTLKYDSWYSKVDDEWVPNFETIEYYVKGEYTTKYGEKYKCIYTNGPEWTDSLTFGIQEGELIQYNEDDDVIVTVFAPDDYGSYSPLGWAETYQFDWDKGKGIFYKDLFMSTTTYAVQYQHYYGIIDEIKEGYFGGVRPLKYVDLDGRAPECGKYDNPQKINTQGGRIIQGIGITEWNDGECLFGPPDPYNALDEEYPVRHYRSMLVHFERNGEVLYNVWPEKETTDDSDYLPFVEMGKLWNVVIPHGEPYYGGSISGFQMIEEVERDGKTYAHTQRNLYAWCEIQEAGLFREENRRVYKYDETTGRDIMMYDFSLKEGDTFTYEFGYDQPVNCKVLKEGWLEDGPDIISSSTSNPDGTLDIKYRKLRTWTIGRENESGEYEEIATWVECIGALENVFGLIDNDLVKFENSLAYVRRKGLEEGYGKNEYLPFSFNSISMHGCDLPTSELNEEYDDELHHLNYEMEGDRLHIYGDVYTQCGPNNYAYFYEWPPEYYNMPTDDPSVRIIELLLWEVAPVADCMAHHHTDFYVTGFDPNLNYYVSDNNGEIHPIINKAPQMAYRPMIEDGKVWKVGSAIGISDDIVKMVDYYYFDGDTIINGKTCKQMMFQRYVSPDYLDYDQSKQPSLDYVGAWYEEDKKVYLYYKGQQSMRMMYDFSLDANTSLLINNDLYLVGTRQTEGLEGFKGIYRDVMFCANEDQNTHITFWLEGVGGIMGPGVNAFNPILVDPQPQFLMSCTVGDEVIYLNDKYEDGATPTDAEAKKHRFDFTHTIKTKPRTRGEEEEQSLYGEYNNLLLGINLNPLDDTYLVRITNESDQVVYEKTINAGSIVGLNIDISAFAKGRYTVTMENSSEVFTGEFETITTGIQELINEEETKNFNSSTLQFFNSIYNLQGQRLNRLQKGLNIVNGRKVLVK